MGRSEVAQLPESLTGPFLDLHPDPSAWLFGPTPARPVEEWLPGAVAVQSDVFGLAPDRGRERELVETTLGMVARRHPSPLPFFVLRWKALTDAPLALFLGLVERDPDGELAGQWLESADGVTVEPPVIEELVAPEGVSLRRGLAYTSDGDGLVVGVRYVVDTGHPSAFLLAHAASDVARDVLEALDDVQELLRTVAITDDPPATSTGRS